MRILFSYTLLFLTFAVTSTTAVVSNASQTNFQLNGIWAANLWSCKTAKRFIGFRGGKFALIDQIGMAKNLGLISSRKWASDGKALEFRTDNETLVFRFDILGPDHMVLSRVKRLPENSDETTPRLKKFLNLQRCDTASIEAGFLREREAGS